MDYDAWSSVLLSVAAGFFAGALLLLCQMAWNNIQRQRHRRAAVQELAEFFRDWRREVIKWENEDVWQFFCHEQMMQLLWVKLTQIRQHLKDRQGSDIVQLVMGHQDLIDSRLQALAPIPESYGDHRPIERHFALLPTDYMEFFLKRKVSTG